MNKYSKLLIVVTLIFGATPALFLIKKHYNTRLTSYSIEPSVCKAGAYLPLLVYLNKADGSTEKVDPNTYKIQNSPDDESAKSLRFEELLDTVFINCGKAGEFPVSAQLDDQKKSIIQGKVKVIAGEPENMIIVSGDNQSGIVEKTFDNPVVLKVTDHWNNPVGNVSVSLDFDSKKVTPLNSTLVSTDDGMLFIAYSARKVAGAIEFKVSGNFSEPVTKIIHFSVEPGSPKRLTFQSKFPDSVIAGQKFLLPKVLLADEFGNMINDKEVKNVGFSLFLDEKCVGSEYDSISLQKNIISISKAGENIYIGATKDNLKTCSNPIKVNPAKAKSFSTQTSEKSVIEAGQIFPTQTIMVKDSFNNEDATVEHDILVDSFKDEHCQTPTTGNSITVDSISIPTSTVSLQNITDTIAESFFLKVSSKNISPTCAGPFTFSHAKANRILLISGDLQEKSVFTDLDPIKVKVVDKFNNVIPDFKVSFKYNDSPKVVSAISDEDGVASAYFKLDSTVGKKTIMIYSDLLTEKDSSLTLTAKTTASQPDHIVIKNQPAKTLIAGEKSETPAVLEIYDKFKNLNTQSSVPILVNQYKDSECKSLIKDSTDKITTQNGQSTYSNLNREEIGTIFLGFSSPGLKPACSDSIQVQPNAAIKLVVTKEPEIASAGSNVSLEVSALDKFNNLSDYSGSLKLTLSDSHVILAGSLNRTAIHGIGSFPDLSIEKAKKEYSILIKGDKVSSVTTQPFSVFPAPVEKIEFLTSPKTVAAAKCSDEVTIQLQDHFSNPSLMPENQKISLTGKLGTFYKDNQCSEEITQVEIHRGHSDGVFYFDRKEVGNFEIIANTDLPKKTASQVEAITVEVASKLRLSGKSSLLSGDCGGPFSVETIDEFNNKSSVKELTSVSLSGSKSGIFFTDSTCSHPITSLSFNKDINSLFFYLKDEKAEKLEILVNTANKELTSSSLELESKELAPVKLSIVGSTSIDVNSCSKAFTVTMKDKFDNSVKVPSDLSLTPILIDNTSIYTDPNCLDFSSTITVEADHDSASFYYKSTQVGSNKITIEGENLEAASIAVISIANSDSSSLTITEQPTEMAINAASKESVIVNLNDSFGNLITTGSKVISIEPYTDPNCTDKAEGEFKAKLNKVSSVKGIAKFSDISYSVPESIYLKISSDKIDSTCSSEIVVSDGSKAD